MVVSRCTRLRSRFSHLQGTRRHPHGDGVLQLRESWGRSRVCSSILTTSSWTSSTRATRRTVGRSNDSLPGDATAALSSGKRVTAVFQ